MIEALAKFTVPLVFNRNKIKYRPFYINLNGFIQASKNTSARNQLKKNYSLIVKDIVKDIEPIKGPVKMIYVIHAKSRAKFDIMNIASVLDKFLCDSLQEYGILEEDNYDYIPNVEVIFGGLDKENPTADVFILPHYQDSRSEYLRNC
jgi:hypothetical protein